MILLTDTNDTLEIALTESPTVQPSVVVAYVDHTTSGGTPGKQVSTLTDAATTTVCSAPGSSTTRQVKSVSVYNGDAASITVTVKLDDNSTEYNLGKWTLSTGERLQYEDGLGWTVQSTYGATKLLQSNSYPAVSEWSVSVLGSDVTNNNAVANTIQDVTGLSFSVVAGGIYHFDFTIIYTAAATTTGSRWSISGPSSPTGLAYVSEYSLTTTTSTRNANLTAYDLPASSNATSGTTGPSNIARIYGHIQPSSNGTVIARFASEVAGSAIVAKAGSIVRYMRSV